MSQHAIPPWAAYPNPGLLASPPCFGKVSAQDGAPIRCRGRHGLATGTPRRYTRDIRRRQNDSHAPRFSTRSDCSASPTSMPPPCPAAAENQGVRPRRHVLATARRRVPARLRRSQHQAKISMRRRRLTWSTRFEHLPRAGLTKWMARTVVFRGASNQTMTRHWTVPPQTTRTRARSRATTSSPLLLDRAHREAEQA